MKTDQQWDTDTTLKETRKTKFYTGDFVGPYMWLFKYFHAIILWLFPILKISTVYIKHLAYHTRQLQRHYWKLLGFPSVQP